MAITYLIDSSEGIVVVTATGPTSTMDVAHSQALLRENPSFRPTYHELFDFRGATPTDIYGSQVEALLHSAPFDVSARRAYVASPGVGYGLGRIAEAVATDHLQLRLFEDVEAARHWLLGETVD